jgi:hypothetical protein
MAKRPSQRSALYAEIDKSLAANAPRAKPNARRSSKGFEIDVSGSSALVDARWSPNGGGTLALTFAKKSAEYLFYGVPRKVARQVDSGEDFNSLIRDQYPYD